MKLHQIGASKKTKKKRIGRGGKRGTYSGKGIKGQKSRAGAKIRPAERDLIIRLPKRRGFKHKPVSPRPLSVNVGELDKVIERVGGSEIDLGILKKAGRIPIRYRGGVKLLGNGDIKNAITAKGFLTSKTAKEKIEKAGGRIMVSDTKNANSRE